MKKLALSLAVLFLSLGLAFGATGSLTVSGKLQIEGSLPVIQADGKTWQLPPGLFSRLALEHSIRAGDSLKIEGLVQENCPSTRFGRQAGTVSVLIPQKIWVNGKEIDVSIVSQGQMKGGPAQAMMPAGRAARGRFSGNMGPGNMRSPGRGQRW